MPGSADKTEGTASAVPSVASGTSQPLTRREARAQREAAEAQAKSSAAKKRAKAAFAADEPAPAAAAPAGKQPAKPAKQAKPLKTPEAVIAAPEPKKSKAGRNLPAAIGVGVVLLGVVLGGLFWYEPLLVVVVMALSGIGCWEVARATSAARVHIPQLPLYLASVLLPASAVLGGIEALGFSYMACLLVIMLVRFTEGPAKAAASIMTSVFITSWIPLLLSFALLILAEDKGQWLVAAILLLAVSNDTFGYIAGVLFGKHPMAPKISPKKSWEGFAGSMAGSMAIACLAMYYWMDMPWWTGLVLGFFTTIAATTGDFAESMVKRELGIKDMSSLLPGHGGIMDRLDSILFVVPLGYLISHLLAWSVAAF